MMVNYKQVYYDIGTKIKKEVVFIENIIAHIEKHIPYLFFYQRLDEKLRPNLYANIRKDLRIYNEKELSSSQYKQFLIDEKYIYLINRVFSTRMSKNGINEINKRLKGTNFNLYNKVLQQFYKCNISTNKKTNKKTYRNAFSFGTKVLHFYDPQNNPMLDSKVGGKLKLKYRNDVLVCFAYRDAARKFIKDNPNHFKIKKTGEIAEKLKEYNLIPYLPRMKLLDMALY